MLSDSIHELRRRVEADGMPSDRSGLLLALQAYEQEARNMENRLELVTGRPHVPLDGRLIAAPMIEIGRTV